ncbi:hypothetical protein [Thiolapillus sp.]
MFYGRSLIFLLLFAATQSIHADALENPKPDDPMSGIGTIYGWQCEAQSIEYQIDDGNRIPIPYGARRPDTQKTCGDADNGYVTQFNFGQLKNGEHRIRVYVDGVKEHDRIFRVARMEKPYMRGLQGEAVVTEFPDADHDITLTWSESAQNFQITAIGPSGSHPLPAFNGLWRVENSAGNVLFQVFAGYRDLDPWLTLSMLDMDSNDLQIYSGLLEGRSAIIDDEFAPVDAAFEMELLNADEMRMTVVHCKPAASCNIRAGDVFTLLRREDVTP